MSRLTGLSGRDIQDDRLTACASLLKKVNSDRVYLVLKGAGTVIMHGNGKYAINSSGNHGMATGGMGDVLAGLLGSLVCQGYTPWDSCCLGVYLHGVAADLLFADRGHGYSSSDVAKTLPRALALLGNG
jgi:NAD(P)H-hydrate epimerase